MIIAIAAYDKEHHIIGRDDGIPWSEPEDMKNFKVATSGHTVLMGRKTYESLPLNFRPLPNRINVIASKSGIFHYKKEGDSVTQERLNFHNLDEFIKEFPKDKKLFVIGGGEIYKHCIENKLVNEIHITEVDTPIKLEKNDVIFPEIPSCYQKETIEGHFKKENLKFNVFKNIS